MKVRVPGQGPGVVIWNPAGPSRGSAPRPPVGVKRGVPAVGDVVGCRGDGDMSGRGVVGGRVFVPGFVK